MALLRLVGFLFFFLEALSSTSAETSIAEDMSWMRFARSVEPSLDVEGCPSDSVGLMEIINFLARYS